MLCILRRSAPKHVKRIVYALPFKQYAALFIVFCLAHADIVKNWAKIDIKYKFTKIGARMHGLAGMVHNAFDIFIVADLYALAVIVVFFVASQAVLNGQRIFFGVDFRGQGIAHVVVQVAHQLDVGVAR